MNTKGITLINVLTIIFVLIIIASIAIIGGTNLIDKTKESSSEDELVKVKTIVNQFIINKGTTNTNTIFYGKSITDVFSIQNEEASNWYLVDDNDLEQLGIKYLKKQYVINYKNNQVLTYNDFLALGYTVDTTTITYHANNVDVSQKEVSYNTLNKTIAQNDFINGNNIFIGWSTSPAGEVQYMPGDNYTGGSIDLYAKWKATTFATYLDDNGNTRYTVFKKAINRLMGASESSSSFNQIHHIKWADHKLDGKYEIVSAVQDEINSGDSCIYAWYRASGYDNEPTIYLWSSADKISLGTNCHDMFSFFENLEEISIINDLHVTEFTNVSSIQSMFRSCKKITKIDLNHIYTDSITTIKQMFNDCAELTELNMGSINTSNVQYFTSAFWGCKKLASITFADGNKFLSTNKATDFSYMFCDCNALTSIDLSGLNTENCIDMQRMFMNCSSLTELDLGSFNTTTKQCNMSLMFSGCKKLKTIYVTDKFQVKKSNSDMFTNCTSIVGGNNTTYNSSFKGSSYAIIDNANGNKGYFTTADSV